MMRVAEKTEKDELGHIGFNAGKERKRAIRMLAAMNDTDVTSFMLDVIDGLIQRQLPEQWKAIQAAQGGVVSDLKSQSRGAGEEEAPKRRGKAA